MDTSTPDEVKSDYCTIAWIWMRESKGDKTGEERQKYNEFPVPIIPSLALD